MGLVKAHMMEVEERGWDSPDKFVCDECLNDDFLKSVVEDNAEDMHCDYCNRSADVPIAAPLSAIMEPIANALFRNFTEPGAAGLPRDTEEWVGEDRITDTEDALLSLPLECEEELFNDIAHSFLNYAWYPCAKGFWLHIPKNRELHYSWEHFVNEIKHVSRFFFSVPNTKEEDYLEEEQSPVDLLEEISNMIESLKLIKNLPASTKMFRVRKTKPGQSYSSFDEMGPPPPDLATAGRMNPAGIPYFYLSFEEETALAEIIDKPPASASLACFETNQVLKILDLDDLPDVPSVFDDENADAREHLLFLNDFVSAITEPILKNSREHIDYVPSQVVSEYLAQVFRTQDGEMLDGIIYPSTMLPSRNNIALFPNRDDLEGMKAMIRLIYVQQLEFANWPQLSERIGLG